MSNNEVTFKHLSVEQLHESLEQGKYVVVDIRDPNSFEQGSIPHSNHLSNDSIGDFLRDADFDAPTVVCCYHGISSQQAAQFLISQDFTDVYSLDGGFTQWQALYPNDIAK
ncbi:thiosulfate sulfurtransferase GlpE [Thalassotalea sp. PLHSN55]|uniref:thiosulfate sulfurtransferase GlpE n=1 Tax=Thalassotalea sp. PLHSN55 TaxID=3435888 RepID=UPI003F84A217